MVAYLCNMVNIRGIYLGGVKVSCVLGITESTSLRDVRTGMGI
jgi:hypothetical protein